MAGFIPPSTATSDTERLHRLQRRLDAWEVMLETPGQTSGNKDWQKRQKRLQELRHRLELLIMRREVPPFLKKQQEIQLPPLEICSEDEHKLCEQYLDAQLKISQHLTD
ncbi:MAG: hypothetical protein NTX25_07815, partial [Proteobacteria bacterium]|nr:hypothetical protein [Pseudomonadota bacterium]